MQNQPRKPPSPLVQLVDILLIELTNWRWSWQSLLTIATIAPLFSVFALGFFARGSSTSTLAYILTGNAVLSLMFGVLDKVQAHFAYMRMFGTLDYFAALPIHKIYLVLALVLGFLLLALPSLFTTIFVGAWLLQLTLHLSPWLLFVPILCALPLASLGALIGVSARNYQEGSAFTLLLSLALTAIGPVIAPPERLPSFMVWLGHFSPATYAADAFRQTLFGPVTGALWFDLLVLVGFSVILFGLTLRRMDWRAR